MVFALILSKTQNDFINVISLALYLPLVISLDTSAFDCKNI